MTDTVSRRKRSEIMSRIRGTDTRPERKIRSLLHMAGFRFRVYRKDLPGNPDIVLPKHRAVVFVHGCFWHSHNCPAFRLPGTRQQFWKKKLTENLQRDSKNIDALLSERWRVLIVWECALRGAGRLAPEVLVSHIADWLLKGTARRTEIGGRHARRRTSRMKSDNVSSSHRTSSE